SVMCPHPEGTAPLALRCRVRTKGRAAMAEGSAGFATETAPPGLTWCSDDNPGMTRRRSGKGFAYRGGDGKPVRDTRTLERIRALAIPPAWTEVWICPRANGHIQAT